MTFSFPGGVIDAYPTHCRCGEMLTTHRTPKGLWHLCPEILRLGVKAARPHHDGWIEDIH